jgi:TonB family protein
MFADTSQTGRKKQLAAILSSLFQVEGNLSNVIAEFISSERTFSRDTTSVEDMVKGLVFDSAAASSEKVQQKKIQPVKKDNSALALKYRSQQSIQKTIREHTPILEGIYKKELKKNANMSGVVYVTFRVAASGEVISATVKSSEIAQRDFINPFLSYVKKINFKAIPETVGPMTFDFPFEFRPEF